MSDSPSQCVACLAPIDPSDRFCRQCGALLEERPEEHRYVTVLFSDLSGYTALSEQLDPEDLKEIMDRIFGRATQIIARYGGTIEKFIGDAVVALFGVALIHEDDAVRAIHAARAIHSFVAESNFPAGLERRLDMHTGIHTGTILAGRQHSIFAHGALGTPINIAARLSALAGPGEILIGESSLFEAERHFLLESLGVKTLKGVKDPIRVDKVIGERDIVQGMRRMKNNAAQLIGRQRELALLQDRLLALGQGESSVIWLKGEAGVGKSRIIHELRQRIPPDVRWCAAHCLEYAKHLPYFPLRTLIQQLSPGQPQAGGCIQTLESPDTDHEARRPEEYRQRISANLQNLVAHAPMPVILCIEDMQWVDESSLDILRYFLKSEHTNGRSLTILTSRDDPPTGLTSLEIEVPELTYPEVTHMVTVMLESASSEAMLSGLYKETGGNPLYVEEMVNYLLDTGAAALRPRSIPGTLKGIISARFDHLGPKTKRILQEAAVIGFYFTLPVLQAIDPELKDQHLMDLQQAGIILSENADTYVFRHAITRETAYESLLKHERTSLHGRIGLALEGLSGENLPDILAHHFCRGHDFRKALQYSLCAAQRCRDSGAWAEAATHYRNAEQAWQREPDDTRTPDVMIQIWEGLWTCSRILNPEQGVVALINLAQAYQDRESRREEVYARIRLINLYTQKAQFEEALTVFKAVLPLTEDDAELRAAAETTIAYAFTYRGLPDVALTYLTAARAAIKPDDLFVRGVNSLMTMTAQVWKGGIDQALLWYQTTRELCRGHKDLELLADLWLGYINYLGGNFARGASIFKRVATAEQVLGAMTGALSYVRTQSSIYFNACYLGLTQEARLDLQCFSRWCDTMQIQGAGALLDLYEGWIALAEERLETAQRHLEMALPALETGIANRVPYALNALAETLMRSHDWEDARVVALNGIAWNRSHGNQEQLIASLRLLGEICIALGDLDQAKSSLAEAGRTARHLRLKPHLAWTYGSYARYWEKLGDHSMAQSWHRKAYDAWTAMGNLYQVQKLEEAQISRQTKKSRGNLF